MSWVSSCAAFQFGNDDIRQLRAEMKTLITRLSSLYLSSLSPFDSDVLPIVQRNADMSDDIPQTDLFLGKLLLYRPQPHGSFKTECQEGHVLEIMRPMKIQGVSGAVFSVIPTTKKGKINTRITVKAQFFYPPYIASTTENIKWQIKVDDTWRDMDSINFDISPEVEEYKPLIPTCLAHNRLFYFFKKNKNFGLTLNKTLMEQWNHHVSISSKSNFERRQAAQRRGFFDKGKVLLENDQVVPTMYHTGPRYDLFNILPHESCINPMILIKSGDVFKATLLCFFNYMQGGQNNTVSIAPMRHDYHRNYSSHLVLHTLPDTSPDVLEMLDLTDMKDFLQLWPCIGCNDAILTMHISGKISTVYSDCIQVDLDSFSKIPRQSLEWNTTCMNINPKHPIDYHSIQEVDMNFLTYRQKKIFRNRNHVRVTLKFETLQLLNALLQVGDNTVGSIEMLRYCLYSEKKADNIWMYDQIRNLKKLEEKPVIEYGEGASWLKNLLKMPTKTMPDPVLETEEEGKQEKFNLYTVHYYVAEALQNVLKVFPELQHSSNYGDQRNLSAIMSRALGATVWQFQEKKSCVNQNIRNKVESFLNKKHQLVRNKEGSKKQKINDTAKNDKIKSLISACVERICGLCIRALQQWMDQIIEFHWESLNFDQEIVHYILLGFMLNKVSSPPPFLQILYDVTELDCSLADVCNDLHSDFFNMSDEEK
jgi:hypothetical protein